MSRSVSFKTKATISKRGEHAARMATDNHEAEGAPVASVTNWVSLLFSTLFRTMKVLLPPVVRTQNTMALSPSKEAMAPRCYGVALAFWFIAR